MVAEAATVCNASAAAPATTSTIPAKPWLDTRSSSISQPVTLVNTGVNARYGSVSASGLSRIARRYSAIASSSSGSSSATPNQNRAGNGGSGTTNSSGASTSAGSTVRTTTSSRTG